MAFFEYTVLPILGFVTWLTGQQLGAIVVWARKISAFDDALLLARGVVGGPAPHLRSVVLPNDVGFGARPRAVLVYFKLQGRTSGTVGNVAQIKTAVQAIGAGYACSRAAVAKKGRGVSA